MQTGKPIINAIVRKYPAIALEDTLEKAIKVMADNNISALVVKSREELVGIVTITDVVQSLANENDPAATSVASFMTRCELISEKATRNPCAQLDESMDALSALKVLHEAGVNHLVVAGSQGEAVGVVSSLELIKLIAS